MPANSEFGEGNMEETTEAGASESSPGPPPVPENTAAEAVQHEEPPTVPVESAESAEPVNWEEKCQKLEKQLTKMAECSALRKRLLEIREEETQNLTSKLKVLSDSISEEKSARTAMLKRVEAAELECMSVKDKLRRNVESLERMRGTHDRKVSMLSANLEIAEIKAQGHNRKLEEAHRKNAEMKGRLEELNLKLHENRKVTKGLERQLKKEKDKNLFLSSQVAMISKLLTETGESSSDSSEFDDGPLKKIKTIIRQSEDASKKEKEKAAAAKSCDEDEGVELTSLELELENEEEPEEVEKEIPDEKSCYKRVDTSDGPKFILSVSRTFIKLKDLILEKRSLQQQIDGLKSLNGKLETKVDKQEHRLYCVTKELNKTWSLVSKLKSQQDKLHNNEAYLRYELKQNRSIVEKLKKEMQSYKEKWSKVKAKNDESQTVWQQLKDEFAQRRQESQQGPGTLSPSLEEVERVFTGETAGESQSQSESPEPVAQAEEESSESPKV